MNFKWLVWFLPVIGIVEIVTYTCMKLAPNMTTHRVISQIRNNEHVSYLLAPGILLTTCMSIVCGASVGKEAGALQIGASLGSLISKPLGIRPIRKEQGREKEQPRESDKQQGREKPEPQGKLQAQGQPQGQGNPQAQGQPQGKPQAQESDALNNYSAACGMAACFAALFFAPLGSCMFVLELTHFRRPVLKHVVTILLACFVAYLVASFIGIGDIIPKVPLPSISSPIVGQCIVIGVAAALVGTLFASGIKLIHGITQRITEKYFLWVIVGGIIFAALITLNGWDALTGTGGDTLTDVLKGEFGPWDFLIKALLTLICLGFWFKGGEIMPSFCIGGLLGASTSFLTGGDPVFGAAIGVLAFFAAFTRCPLAAFLMGCEIFGWAAAPFLGIAILVSFMFGYPVGMYGEGIGRGVHALWRRASAKMTGEARNNGQESQVTNQ